MNPNKTGKAFEAIVLEYLIQALKSKNISAKYSLKALEIQEGYIKFFNDLSDNVKSKKYHSDFISNTPKLVEWIINYFELNLCEIVIIHKFKDSEADKNVADLQLRVTYDGTDKVINLSLKNNHDALKHSRIGPVPTWLGFTKNDVEYIEYTNDLKVAREKIRDRITKLSHDNNISIINYKDIDLINKKEEKYSTLYKNQHIYPEFYQVIKNFMENQIQNKDSVNLLFHYFMSEPHYKIINKEKEFIIYDFTSIPNASSVNINIDSKNGYLLFHFDNGYTIKIRLHNDKSKILKSFNYKCDIKLFSPDELNIKKFILKK
ncbi:hypothetical protein AB9M91_18880 [Bacillus safensis]|uniref:hypothetical protein n=1 Tax=Bacillus safensis TaxID=561879 RepID=UPI0035173E02